MPVINLTPAKTGKINTIKHPEYRANCVDWTLYRDIFNGGRDFRKKYLVKSSKRETDIEFVEREATTPIPGHAKTSIYEVRNALYERFVDIKRMGGSPRYQEAVKGERGGVDGGGSSMNKFMGTKVLPELLALGRVAIMVDAPSEVNLTKSESQRLSPYLYTFKTEQIRSWNYEQGELVSVLLEEVSNRVDENTGLVVGEETRFLLYRKVMDGVTLKVFTAKGDTEDEYFLNLTRIPVVILDLGNSLLCDIAYHQIALLNLGSLDLAYAFKANFPFYTEQFNPQAESANQRTSGNAFETSDRGSETNATTAKPHEISVGPTKGRRYAKDLDRPGFIHPSSEPIEASMSKQENLRMEIRQLVLLSVANLDPKRQSQESKEWDNQGLYAGLSFIGLTLQHAEQEIAKIFSDYENGSEVANISYPDKYNIRTDEERRKEGKEILDLLPTIPSKTFQRIYAKKAATVLVGNDATEKDLKKVMDEIEKAEVLAVDPEVIRSDVEAQLVDPETASRARLYPEGSAKKAEFAHAERAKRIAEAQQSGNGLEKAGARGIADLSADPDEAKNEKKDASNPDLDDRGSKRQRGKGRGGKEDGTN